MTPHSIFPFGHDALSFVSAVATTVAALLMAGIRVPHTKRWRSYRRMRTILVTSYLVLSLSNFITSLLQAEEDSPELLATVTLIVASLQALLFTATCLTFVRPLIVTRRRLTAHFSVIAAAGALLLTLMAYVPKVFPCCFWTAMACYAVQLVLYTLVFHRSFIQCTRRLEQHYDEEESGRLGWIRRCFHGALGIGVTALAFSIPRIGIPYYECFMVVYTLYYVYMCHCMMTYRTSSTFIVEVMGQAAEPETENAPAEELPYVPAPKEQALEEALEKWQKDKRFKQADVSPDEVAAQLGTSRRYLSWYFTTRKHTTFRSWRLKLRIAEAERLLRECPSTTVAELHELVGMGDRSNFHKHFRLTTGFTPSEYKARFGAHPSHTD